MNPPPVTFTSQCHVARYLWLLRRLWRPGEDQIGFPHGTPKCATFGDASNNFNHEHENWFPLEVLSNYCIIRHLECTVLDLALKLLQVPFHPVLGWSRTIVKVYLYSIKQDMLFGSTIFNHAQSVANEQYNTTKKRRFRDTRSQN